MTPKNVLLSINSEGNIIYWHTTSGKILHKISEKKNSLLCIDYNIDGSLFAVGGDDKTIKIYDENMKIVVNQFLPGSNYRQGHQGRINSICFHKDKNYSNLFASGGWDKKVYINDTRTSKLLYFNY